MADINKETVPGQDLKHGHTLVGLTKTRLTEKDITTLKGLVVRCPGTTDPGGGNIAAVWIGGNGVSADSDPETGGMPLVPGATLFIPCDKPSHLWIISNEVDQDVAWIAI